MSLLGDLIDEAVRDAGAAADAATSAIDLMIRQAAVQLMNAVLPPMVHANHALVKAESWVVVERASGIVHFTLGTAEASNHVLSGRVADKVSEGVRQLSSNNDFERALGSIS